MPDFDITIKTPTELTGAVQCADALEKDIGKAKALGQEFGALEAKLAAVKTSIKQYNDTHLDSVAEAKAGEEAYLKEIEALGQNADGSKKAAEGMEKLGVSHHQLHHILNELMPGLGQLATFLTSGFTAAIGVALIAYTYLNSKVEEFNKLLDELSTGPGARGEWAEHIKEQAEQAAVAFATWEHHIDRVISAERTLAQVTDAAIALDKEKASSDATVAAAKKALDEARLDMAVKLGQMTEEQAIKIKLQIDEDYFKAQLQAKIAGIEAEIGARSGEKRSNQLEALGLDDKIRGEKTAADAAAAAKTKNDDQIAQAKTNKEAADAAAKKADDRLMQPHHWGDRGDTFEREQAEAMGERAREQATQYGKEIKQGEAKKQGLDTAAAITAADYEAEKALYEEHVKADKDLTAEISKLNAQLANQKAEAGKLETLHNQTAEANAAGATPGAEGQDIEKWTQKTNDNIGKAAQANPNAALAMISGAFQDINQFLATHPALNQANWDKLQKEWEELRKDQAIILQRLANRRD